MGSGGKTPDPPLADCPAFGYNGGEFSTEVIRVKKQYKPLGLYIHIPFCKSKCIYCDFYSLPGAEDQMDRCVSALCLQLAETAQRTMSGL